MKKAQQEMIGFVLIVILVVIALLVFLVIIINSPKEQKDLDTENALEAIMKTTTGCAIVFEPQYDNFENLFIHCFENKKCSNLNVNACDYLNSSLSEILSDIYKSDSSLDGFSLSFTDKDNEKILKIEECTGKTTRNAQRNIIYKSENLAVTLKFCGS